jgi:L-lactate dehydrogenase complex protein LldF
MSLQLPPILNQTLADARLQDAIYTNTGRAIQKRKAASAEPLDPDFQTLRAHARRLKEHALSHLDHYLETFESLIVARGGRVVWAEDGQQALDCVLQVARQHGARLMVKSKSMTTEEIHFNHHLEEHGLEVVETDLGEYIVQLGGETPYHIVTPALHKTRYDVADLFEQKLHEPREEDPEKQTAIARRVLREKFLQADIGVTGANFLVADSGAVVVVENEGNARMSASAPRVQIVVAGIEKVIPRLQDLPVFLNLLGRSATGQSLTVYTSLMSGPRRNGERDGPDEFIVILLDNGRTRLLADESRRETLYCIRCGACLNHCPVYRKVGGYTYPTTYSGPIGAILTPQHEGPAAHPWLPYASSLCGVCAEVCPVKIDIPRILLDLRADVVDHKRETSGLDLERAGFRAWAWLMRHPRLYEQAFALGASLLPGDGEWLRSLPGLLSHGPLRAGPAADWLAQRDAPPPAARSFRALWRERKAGPR